jgi:hypothetical protein
MNTAGECAIPISTGKIAVLALGILALSGCAVSPYGGYGNQGYNQQPPPDQESGRYNSGYGNLPGVPDGLPPGGPSAP